MGYRLADPNAIAASDGEGTAHAGVIGKCGIGTSGTGRDPRPATVPLPAKAPLFSLTVRAVADGDMLADNPCPGRDQPVDPCPDIAQFTLLLRVQRQRQLVIHPVAPPCVEHGRGGIVIGSQGVVLSHPADIQRAAAESFRQHPRRTVEIELYGTTLTVDVGNDHLGLPASGK